jgi:pimeloyl-ACP methyl ester carboxylesterase
VAEAGGGEALVLQHGWPENWYAWRKVIPTLAQRYRVICPDLRGFGWSDAPPGRYEKETFAADLLALLDALGLERVRFVGHDWGGMAGYLACLRAPERFERLAVMSITSPWYRPPLSPLLLLAASYQFVLMAPLLGPLLVRPVARRLVKAGAARSDTFSDEDLAALTDQFRDPARARATAALYRSFQLRELPAMVRGKYKDARLSVPGLGLWGDHDPIITERSFRAVHAHADSFEVEKITGAGHFLAEEQPDQVLARLEPFLAA